MQELIPKWKKKTTHSRTNDRNEMQMMEKKIIKKACFKKKVSDYCKEKTRTKRIMIKKSPKMQKKIRCHKNK